MSAGVGRAYWLIGVPNDKDESNARSTLSGKLSGVAKTFPFSIPVSFLKVGTLDSLLTLSDELSKLDSVVEQTTKKIERSLFDVWKSEPKNQDDNKDLNKKDLSPQLPELKVSEKQVSAEEFLENFSWDDSRYSKRKPINTIADAIFKEVNKADEELKVQLANFNETKSSLLALEKKDGGSLLVKPLGQYVKKSDLVDTEHLTTLLVVIPKPKEKEFLDCYEILEDLATEKELEKQKEKDRLKKNKEEAAKRADSNLSNNDNKHPDDNDQQPKNDDKKEEKKEDKSELMEKKYDCKNVVPKSAFKINTGSVVKNSSTIEEEEFVLYAVIVLKKGVDSFKNLCRDRRFTVRQFKFDPEEEKSQKEKKKQLDADVRERWAYLIRWCKTMYSEVFVGWIHVKALRLFVESVLRYGMPIDFSGTLIKPVKNQDKRARQMLNELYGRLAGSMSLTEQLDSSETDISGVGNEFYPYVSLPIILLEQQ